MADETPKSTLYPTSGQVVPSIQTDETRQLAQSAFNKALSASAAAAIAQSLGEGVAADATNAASTAAEAKALAETAQSTADDAISKWGGTMVGELILPPYEPISDWAAAPKQYVIDYVDEAIDLLTGGTSVTDIMDAINAKADLEYVDAKFALKLANSTFDAYEASTEIRLDAGEAAVAELYDHILPYGCIVMWSGFSTDIPPGWKLCNGFYGTPDLRQRFIMAATGDGGATPAHTLGDASATLSSSGSHTHTGTINSAGGHTHTVGNHTLTIGEMPAHTHQADFSSGANDFLIYDNTGVFGTAVSISGSPSGIFRRTRNTYTRGGGNPHDHPLSTNGAHTHTATIDAGGSHTHTATDLTPKFYALCFIQLVPAGTPP